MKKLFNLSLFILLVANLSSQTDSLPLPTPISKPDKIASVRQELLLSFLNDDPAGAGLWIDSLSRLEDENLVGLAWDERWLLYFWTESYGTLLEELPYFDETQRAIQSWKIQPPHDSLFEWIDFTLYEKRFETFSSIRNAFLSEEEKVFCTLLFEYLLRLNKDEEEWADRLQSFENLYPSSKFLPFVRSVKPHVLKPSKMGIGFSIGLFVGNPNDELERSINTPVGFNLDVYFWLKRWNFLFDLSFSAPGMARDLVVKNDVWPKGDPNSFVPLNLMAGYDIVNNEKIRIAPCIGAGLGILKPPTPEEDEEPLPAYYSNFNFTEAHLCASLNIDLKLFRKNYRSWNSAKGSYHGVRLKFGWTGLNFGQDNPKLRGQMFGFSLNYNFLGILPKN